METTKIGTSFASSEGRTREVLSEDQYNLIMEDPFAFYVIQIIQVGNFRSVRRLQAALSFQRGLQGRLLPLLKRMEDLGLISLVDGQIEVHKNNFRFKLSRKAQARLFPALFELAAERAVNEFEVGEQRPMIFRVSEDPETRREVAEAIERFRTNLREIGERVRGRPNPSGARFIGVVTAQMLGHDFVTQSEAANCPESWSPREVRKRLRDITQAAHDIRPALSCLKAVSSFLSGSESSEIEGDAGCRCLSNPSNLAGLPSSS